MVEELHRSTSSGGRDMGRLCHSRQPGRKRQLALIGLTNVRLWRRAGRADEKPIHEYGSGPGKSRARGTLDSDAVELSE